MRFLLVLFIGVLFSSLAIAQDSAHKATEINFYTQKFSLSETQTNKLASVLERKYVAFEAIQRHKGTEQYAAKLKTLYKGTINSIQLLMDTPTQEENFRLYRMELRKQKAQMMKQFRKNGEQPKAAEYKYYIEVFFPKE